MKHRKKRLIAVVITLFCITLALSFCMKDNTSEFILSESFERYFKPDEYAEEFSTITETVALEKGRQYQLKIEAECNQGTIDIMVKQDGKDNVSYDVSTQQPCQETITIDKVIAKEINFIITIVPETNAYFKVDILSK